jgi:bifunctional pyridoxal-dependent enzyme with beta-cystathionase and maltose regulon repressor activities
LAYRWPVSLPQALAQFARDRVDWAVEPTMVTVIPDVIVGIGQAIEVPTAPGEAVVISSPVYPPFFSLWLEPSQPYLLLYQNLLSTTSNTERFSSGAY